jgi:outer membrane receptor protein involved in Fe transport
VKNLFDGFKQHRITVGAGYKYALANDLEEQRNFLIMSNAAIVPAGPLQPTDALGVNPFAPTTDRHIAFGLIQDEWNFANDWTLTTGVRYDHYSDVGSTVNPRASLLWQIDPSLSAKLMYGRAFRAPSFIELYTDQGPQLQGNPTLKPETIDTLEFSVNKKWQYNLSTGATLFWYSSKDLIAETTNTFRTFANTSGADGYGVEFVGQYRPTDALSLDVNYTFLELSPKQTHNDSFIVASPRHDIFAQINWQFIHDWNVNLRSSWILDRRRAANDPRESIDDYVMVGLALRRDNLLDGLGLTFKVDNLFDVDARHPSINGLDVPNDYPVAGISFTGIVEYRF